MKKYIVLSQEALRALHKIAKRKDPYYIYSNDTQFISNIIFLKRNTSPCLICGKEISVNSFNEVNEHGLFHLKEYNLIALL